MYIQIIVALSIFYSCSGMENRYLQSPTQDLYRIKREKAIRLLKETALHKDLIIKSKQVRAERRASKMCLEREKTTFKTSCDIGGYQGSVDIHEETLKRIHAKKRLNKNKIKKLTESIKEIDEVILQRPLVMITPRSQTCVIL